MSEPQYHAIVVGGGLAGIQAAVTLRAGGYSVLLLESRDRLGGRTWSTTADGYYFDVGGQWVGATHTLLRQLCDRLNIQVFPQYDEGKHVLEINGTTTFYSGNISTLNSSSLNGVFKAIDTIDAFANTIDPAHPHLAERAKEWDAMSVAEWTKENVPERDAKAIIDWFVRVCLTFEPHEVSFLYFLLFIKSAGSYALLADIHGGAQQDRIVGGSQQVSEKLAESGLPSGSILYNKPVRRIVQERTHVRVHTDNDVYVGKFVVVAMPPALAGRIDYFPPMTTARDELTQRFPMGTVIKTIVIYDKPFWREAGFSAEAISDQGPIFICYDDSSHDDKKHAIVGFIAATAAKEWAKKPYEERRRAVLLNYARWWGDQALNPRYYIEKDWKTEEYSRGCYVGVAGPGVLSTVGSALRDPVGRIHWCSTESATRWIGYMEGALESGERAGKEVVQRLKQDTPLNPKL